MEQIATFVEYIAFLFGLLVAGILLFINNEPNHPKRVLAFVLLLLSLTGLVGVLFLDGIFLKYPYLFRVNQPLTLLIMPVAYLYIRSVLNSEIKFSTIDWLLIIPSVLQAINLIPFFILPVDEKRRLIQEQLNNPSLQSKFNEGFLPPYVFSFIRFGWSFIFVIINYRLISLFKKKGKRQVLSHNKELLQWLTIFNTLFAVLLVNVLIAAIVAPVFKTGIFILDLSVGVILLTICIQLFIRPKLLYGLYQPIQFKTEMGDLTTINSGNHVLEPDLSPVVTSKMDEWINNSESFRETINDYEGYRYKKVIETLFRENAPYLQTNYTLDQLVSDTNIPRYILSAFINREYGMGFREFLNRYRVNYFKENLHNPDWKNLTLEAISAQCGFSNRSTFINNFKQIAGQTPSEYIKAFMQTGSANGFENPLSARD